MGPRTPPGPKHKYHIQVFALDTTLTADPMMAYPALEAALKFKETCGLHAEAFSAAEVKHGPMALVGPHFPVLCFAQDDDTLESTLAVAREFRGRGAQVLVAAPGLVLERIEPGRTVWAFKGYRYAVAAQ